MTLRILGAIMIISGCAGLGVRETRRHRKEVNTLKQLMYAMEYMECELQYKLTPLPQLCEKLSSNITGIMAEIFQELALELNNQISPDVKVCMDLVLHKQRDIQTPIYNILTTLGMVLGRFDIDGQIREINLVKSECEQQLECYMHDADTRLRSYRTIAVCTGIAVAIILF